MIRARTSLARAGFTLLELMAVILIISILSAFLVPRITSAVDRAKVTACQSNLQEISRGFLEYQTQYQGSIPNKFTGVAFFTSLIHRKVWPAEQATSKRMFCPAIDRDFLTPGQEDIPLAEWYTDAEQLDGTWSTYAGRNTRDHPLRKFPGSEADALVADDNDPENNHGTTTNVLWGNGVVFPLELQDLIDDGTISDPEEVWLEVGPGSPVEALRKLSLD